MAPSLTAALFLGLVLLVAAGLVFAARRFGSRRAALGLAAGLVAWLLYVGGLAAAGVLGDPARRPPGMLLVALPILALVAWLSVSDGGARIARAVPPGLLIGAQVFRIGVELLLHRLWQEGLAPRMLTFEGANFDILVGLTAPLAAWAATRGRAGAGAALAWTLGGLALLGNVVLRAVLTAPGGLNLLPVDPPNRLPGLFPYAYLAGFLAPLALVLHVLAIRALRRRLAPPTLAPAG